ncbi:MAG: YgiQ family radical SAM protein [Bilophila wadsworthia]
MPGLPLLAGGIEASLRRITHYDFWADSLRRSILFDARLDIAFLRHGRARPPRRRPAARRRGRTRGRSVRAGARGWGRGRTSGPGFPVRRGSSKQPPSSGAEELDGLELVRLPSHDEMLAVPRAYLDRTVRLERETHRSRRILAQPNGDRTVLLMPPAAPLTTEELDGLRPAVLAASASFLQGTDPGGGNDRHEHHHPSRLRGGCSFCSLALHQGRRIASRSEASILDEAKRIAAMPRGGSISDVGGPSANMWGAACRLDPSKCRRDSCMYPSICKGFSVDQRACIDLLRDVQATPGVKHVRVASGVRFDLALKDATALAAYTGEFTGGQLKIAPEHCVPDVLDLMRKPGMKPFEAFLEAFVRYSEAHGKEQYVIPYLMSAFPGCTDAHMRQLGDWLAARNWSPRQVQCFIPTPGTVATAMYYARCTPDGAPIYVARTDEERRRQHEILLGRPSGQRPRTQGNRNAFCGKERRRGRDKIGGAGRLSQKVLPPLPPSHLPKTFDLIESLLPSFPVGGITKAEQFESSL